MFFKLVFLALLSVVASDYCYNGPYETEFCLYGCCTGSHSSPCCSFPVGTIVAIVVGVIVFLIIVIIAVVCGRRRYIVRSQMNYSGLQTQVVTTNTVHQSGGHVYGGPHPFYAQGPPPPYTTTSTQNTVVAI